MEDLDYSYPEEAVAAEPVNDFRTLFDKANGERTEMSKEDLLQQISSGDLLVVNNTQVSPRRVFTEKGLEILFVKELELRSSGCIWEVMFPARKMKEGERLDLPGQIEATLVAKGIPQKILLSRPIDREYFSAHGEPALPPYIQKVRDSRKALPQDKIWYRNNWGEDEQSSAAPTASLHFTAKDLNGLKERGVNVAPVTLHVGLGTFLPVRCKSLEDHHMHSEWARVPRETQSSFERVKRKGGRVWGLGTTVTRTLESWQSGLLDSVNDEGDIFGTTDLFIRPGFEFKAIDVLMTNFHQPKSTLLALVCAFAGKERVMNSYQWAIKNQFRLFSYGDLSVWERPEL